MSDRSSGRGLSIGQRLMVSGGAAICAIAVMLAIGSYKSNQLDAALTQAIDIKNKVEEINELRLSAVEITLAAMDTIIDRDEGKIQPDRQAIFDQNSKALTSALPVIMDVAAKLGQSGNISSYESDLKRLLQASGPDLKNLVETRANDEAYAAIDDVIDQVGDKVAETLASLYSNGNKLVETQVAEATQASKGSIAMQLSVGLIAFVVVFALQIINT